MQGAATLSILHHINITSLWILKDIIYPLLLGSKHTFVHFAWGKKR
jgi:hypothetical protein